MVFKKRRMGRRGSFRGFGRRFAKRSGMGKTTNLIQLDAMAYGAVRSYVSQLISPLTSKIPIVGNLSDEVGMGLVNWMVAKNVRGFIGDVARKGLIIENARVGEGILGGVLGGAMKSNGVAGYDSGYSY